MSLHSETTNDTPPTPGEQAERAVQDARAARQVPSEAATPEQAAAGSVSPETVPPTAVTDGDAAAPTPSRARPADGTVGPGEVEVECPGCGLLLVGESPRPTAAWFCPACDFPVFWAAPSPQPSAPEQRRARRRLPGTAGRETLAAEVCWNCGERNEPGVTACLRCAATLPKPPTPEAEKVVVEVERLVAVPHLVRMSSWAYLAAGLLGGAAIAVAATLLVVRLAGGLA
ncbi:MAG: hypothetical protein ACLFS9_06435 [Nitriliruptoraceae bacterium]